MFRKIRNVVGVPKSTREEGLPDWAMPLTMLLLAIVIVWVGVGLIFGGTATIITDNNATPGGGGQAPVVIGTPSTTQPTTPGTTIPGGPGTTPGTVDPGEAEDSAEVAKAAGLAVFTGNWEGVPVQTGLVLPPADITWPDAVVNSVELVYEDGSTKTYNLTVAPEGEGSPERTLAVTLVFQDGMWKYGG